MRSDFVPDEGSDGLRDVLSSLARGWVAILAVAILGGLAGVAYSLSQTPEYSATATLYVTSGLDDNSNSAFTGGQAAQQRVASYTRLIDSDGVIGPAIAASGLGLSKEEAKQSLSASASADTVLLNISAQSPRKGDAARLANSVASAMTSFVQKLETPAGGGRALAKLTLITPAEASSDAVVPRTKRNIALGVGVGLVLGVLGVLLRTRLNNRVVRESDLLSVHTSPVLASIPKDDLLSKRGLIDFREGATAAAEAFRKLRTNLTFANVDHPPKTVLVTSAVAVEGKTTTAMNLAAALVESDNRVVLVDADLRRPQVNARSGLVGDVGLTNYLRGDGGLNDLVQPTRLDGLWILASGPKPPNPAELLGSRRTAQALQELGESFDYVIVDAPPVLPVTDAVVLSQWMDGVILVARSGSTRIPDISDAVEQILTAQKALVGFVLTEAPTDRARYGYYAVKPKRRISIFGRNREPKAMEQVLEPKHSSKH